ncbi:glycerophosphocholine phosphodiesterase GPCPD1-like isoform X2 [Lucilia cuprina]|uniref:glycerophosphocholine phosphodiesterase GPCPD1-like isoform X2 n=1 Tax=Lucilia cuprina TaxID=7375 RepID=UPI001F06B534|nr:glycerophosphocholine phosphodiesterase GPCPD1-like isoform X2 [Lucilia cuprina]
MHRWFFADDEIVCKDLTPPSSPTETPKTSSSSSLLETEWIFKVKFNRELCSNETLAISGNCAILGNWNVQHSVPLSRHENSLYWTLTVNLPLKYDIHYRYLVCALNARGQRIVRFWETHCEARLISRHQKQDIESLECETFGIYKDKIKLERGWINPYSTIVQFKFYQNPFVLKHIISSPLYIKITPLKIKDQEKCEVKSLLETESLIESLDKNQTQTFAYCEVASLQDKNGEFIKQSKYGTRCGCDDIIIFNLTLGDIEHTAYQLDLFNYTSKSAPDVPPHHFGYQNVLPQDMKSSEGTLNLAIMCGTKHRPIGSMKCDYLMVRPMLSNDFNMEKTFQRHWNIKHEGIFVGHRGCGRSYWFQNNILRENTINSFNLAFEHGADMVEFDVQLTKDMIPIVYHDFQLYISKNLDIDQQEYDVMHLPLTPKEIDSLKILRKNTENLEGISVSKFTLDQLKRVKVYEQAKDNVTGTSCSLNIKDNRPFMTLERVLTQVNNKIGYIIEIKWPQKLADGILADFDKNEYVDRILQVVLQKAGSRRIVFSSFDADICTMIFGST